MPSDLLNEQVKEIVVDFIQIFNNLLKVLECSLRGNLHAMPFLGLLGVKMDQNDRILFDLHVKSIIINRLRPFPQFSQNPNDNFPSKNAHPPTCTGLFILFC